MMSRRMMSRRIMSLLGWWMMMMMLSLLNVDLNHHGENHGGTPCARSPPKVTACGDIGTTLTHCIKNGASPSGTG